MNSKPIKNWSEVTPTVSNVGEKKQKNIIDKLRRINYRNELEKQIQEHNTQFQKKKVYKQRERENIVGQTQKQKQKQFIKKLEKVKTQQWYQLQNLDLIKVHKNKKHPEGKYDRNQFFKLQDNEKQRKIQTKRNFELQNKLNDKQVEIKNKSKSREKQDNYHQKQLYNQYIENEYKKQQTDRQLWKNKYLFDKSMIQLGENKDYDYAYRSFLRKQIEQKNKNKRQQEKLDKNLKNINRTAENLNSSPAYLGIITESFDRKKQLSLVDKHLHFEPALVYRRQFQRRTDTRKTNQAESLKIESSLPELHRKKQIQFSQKQRSQINRYSQRPAETVENKKARQFVSYDFITGTQKTFFV